MEDRRLLTKGADDARLKILRREITDLKKTLRKIDKNINNLHSVDSIREEIKKILGTVQEMSDKKQPLHHHYQYCEDPILDLLSVGPLSRTEVPLVVLNQLISMGFDVNSCNFLNKTCLDVAIEKHHYDAIRLLVKHGAKTVKSFSIWSVKPPFVSLASQPNVPLDLFDMLATLQNLNDCSGCPYLPLHTAVSCGHTAAALHLINLGASVNQLDGYQKLPIEYFVEKCTNYYDIKLFIRLLPLRFSDAHIPLRLICKTLCNERLHMEDTFKFEMFQQLVQRLHFGEQLKVQINDKDIAINGVIIDECHSLPSVHVDICTLILAVFHIDLASTPNQIDGTLPSSVTEGTLNYEQATDDLWKNYHNERSMASLQRLCILCTRNSMHNLDDENFLSLPIPPLMRILLTYRDLSGSIFDQWRQGLTVSSYSLN